MSFYLLVDKWEEHDGLQVLSDCHGLPPVIFNAECLREEQVRMT